MGKGEKCCGIEHVFIELYFLILCDTLTIIVLLFPPRAFLRSFVKTESLNGTKHKLLTYINIVKQLLI